MIDVVPELSRPAPPPVFRVALGLVVTGAVIAAADLVANTVGVYAAMFAWRENIANFEYALVLLSVPGVLNLAALLGTGALVRRTARRSRTGRIGLAVLMFCFVPGAVVNYSVTELLFVFWALSDWGSGGNSEVPDWAAALLGGSMIADAVLLLIALAAGILLVLRTSAAHTDRP